MTAPEGWTGECGAVTSTAALPLRPPATSPLSISIYQIIKITRCDSLLCAKNRGVWGFCAVVRVCAGVCACACVRQLRAFFSFPGDWWVALPSFLLCSKHNFSSWEPLVKKHDAYKRLMRTSVGDKKVTQNSWTQIKARKMQRKESHNKKKKRQKKNFACWCPRNRLWLEGMFRLWFIFNLCLEYSDIFSQQKISAATTSARKFVLLISKSINVCGWSCGKSIHSSQQQLGLLNIIHCSALSTGNTINNFQFIVSCSASLCLLSVISLSKESFVRQVVHRRHWLLKIRSRL